MWFHWAGPEGDATLVFLQNPLGFLERNTEAYGGVVGLQLGGELVALVTDPAVAKYVLIDGASIFVKVRHRALEEWLGTDRYESSPPASEKPFASEHIT